MIRLRTPLRWPCRVLRPAIGAGRKSGNGEGFTATGDAFTDADGRPCRSSSDAFVSAGGRTEAVSGVARANTDGSRSNMPRRGSTAPVRLTWRNAVPR